ncbi:MAG TPA: DoxX family protein [Puia sp.]|nr:DoxX family protein [Puia sp.]
MKNIVSWFLNPPVTGRSTILIIRLMAGTVFFWEGLLKFMYVNQGVGRFTKLGFPFPETTAHVIATGEMIGGLLLIFGLFTRITAFYFIVQMIVAVLSTKIDLYFGRSPLPMPPAPPKMGFWAVLHEIRSDYAQILACLFLLIEGAGRRSLDFIISTSRKVYTITLPTFKENRPPLLHGVKKEKVYRRRTRLFRRTVAGKYLIP